jgi:phage host-nuclease inhibitor protein Gam
MPPVKLADTRCLNLDGAKVCLEQIAHAECRIASQRARYEKAIAKAKSRFEEETAADTRLIQERAAMLRDFILAHRDQFQKPRAVKTEFGSFGLRAVSNVAITDEAALVQFARDQGYTELIETITRIRKETVRVRLELGEIVPGAAVARGDEAFYKVDKALLETATTLAEPTNQD